MQRSGLAARHERRYPVENPAQIAGLAEVAVNYLPAEARYWRTLGLAHYRAGDWRQSVQSLTTSLAKARPDEDQAATMFCLSMACRRLGQYAESQSWFKKGAKLAAAEKTEDPQTKRLEAEAAALLNAPQS